MQEESDNNDRWRNILMDLANIGIIIILTASIVFEKFSIYIAIGSSLLIWLIFGGFFVEIKHKWQEKRNLVNQGIPLHQFCDNCSLRFSISKNQCPRCDTIAVSK